jgi:hypothetical protein
MGRGVDIGLFGQSLLLEFLRHEQISKQSDQQDDRCKLQ